MSLKRRNIIALVLLLSAAAGWTFGQQLLDSPSGEYSTEGTEEETYFGQTYTEPGTEIAVEIHTEAATEIASESEVHSDFSSELLTEWETEAALGFASESMTEWETEAASEFASEPAYETESEMVSEFTEVWTDDSVLPGEASGQNGAGQARARRFIGFLLSFAAVVAAGAAIFALFQKNPICGPDGIFLLFAAMAAVNSALQGISYRPGAAAAAVLLLLSGVVTVFLFFDGHPRAAGMDAVQTFSVLVSGSANCQEIPCPTGVPAGFGWLDSPFPWPDFSVFLPRTRAFTQTFRPLPSAVWPLRLWVFAACGSMARILAISSGSLTTTGKACRLPSVTALSRRRKRSSLMCRPA